MDVQGQDHRNSRFRRLRRTDSLLDLGRRWARLEGQDQGLTRDRSRRD